MCLHFIKIYESAFAYFDVAVIASYRNSFEIMFQNAYDFLLNTNTYQLLKLQKKLTYILAL